MNKKNCTIQTITFAFVVLPLIGCVAAVAEEGWTKLGADNNFAGWYNSDKWDVAGDAALNPDNIKRLVGKAGDGVLINGKEGKTTVIEPGLKFRKLAVNELDGFLGASPAVAGKSLLLRTKTHLYRVQRK